MLATNNFLIGGKYAVGSTESWPRNGLFLPLNVNKNKMSLLLRFASLKCPGRTISCVKRFYMTRPSFTFLEGLGIRYFIPRTADTHANIPTERMKDRESSPEEFQVIYNFPHEEVIGIVSTSALVFAVMLIYIIYDPNILMELDEHKKEEENEPITEEPVLEDNYIFSGILQELNTLSHAISESQCLNSGKPREKCLVGLAMIIFFFWIRSRCVVRIYRHNNDYATVLYQAFGFGKKVINHKVGDCCYYPKRKFFNYNLMGRNVLVFSESFVNYEERQLYIRRERK